MVLGEVPHGRYNISINFVKDGWVGECLNSSTAADSIPIVTSSPAKQRNDAAIFPSGKASQVFEFAYSPTQPSFTKFTEILYLPSGTSPRTKNQESRKINEEPKTTRVVPTQKAS